MKRERKNDDEHEEQNGGRRAKIKTERRYTGTRCRNESEDCHHHRTDSVPALERAEIEGRWWTCGGYGGHDRGTKYKEAPEEGDITITPNKSQEAPLASDRVYPADHASNRSTKIEGGYNAGQESGDTGGDEMEAGDRSKGSPPSTGEADALNDLEDRSLILSAVNPAPCWHQTAHTGTSDPPPASCSETPSQRRLFPRARSCKRRLSPREARSSITRYRDKREDGGGKEGRKEHAKSIIDASAPAELAGRPAVLGITSQRIPASTLLVSTPIHSLRCRDPI
ncbi:hypothetical protein DFP72DRAFT_1108451 [Ephemerocybe angulata]|uniref:Uncharacterized protein n=1 Tax=Ephemerocybe angulata TaxID=980116 RepID=A0A8H6IJV1_9AGAR|nr:hypothetical protein DFP72DRAFT_1108451 [Tulosesus angulatus]